MAKKLIIYRDELAISTLKDKLNEFLPLIQNVYELFKTAEFFKPDANLTEIVFNLENIREAYKMSLVKEELRTQSDRLQINENQAMQLFQLKGTEELDNAIQAAASAVNSGGIDLGYFEIVEGSVKISSGALQFFIDRNSMYAETPKEIELYNLHMSFIKAAIDFNDFLITNKLESRLLIRNMSIAIARFFDWNNEEYSISRRGFGNLKRQLSKNSAPR